MRTALYCLQGFSSQVQLSLYLFPHLTLEGLVYPNSQKSLILKDLGYFSIMK